MRKKIKRILVLLIAVAVTGLMMPAMTVLTFAADEDLPSGTMSAYGAYGGSYGGITLPYDLTITSENEHESVSAQVYIRAGGKKAVLKNNAELYDGTEVFVKPLPANVLDEDRDHAVCDISINGESVFDEDHYDCAEGAYCFEMPCKGSVLTISYDEAVVSKTYDGFLQLGIGETLDIADCAELIYGDDAVSSDRIRWQIVGQADGSGEQTVLEYADDSCKVLSAAAAGEAEVWAYADGNSNIGVMFHVEVFASRADMAEVIFNDSGDLALDMLLDESGDSTKRIPGSGYLVPKGSVIRPCPTMTNGTVLSELTVNGRSVKAGATFTVSKKSVVKFKTREAVVKGVPEKISLRNKGDKYDIDAAVRYSGSAAGVYDDSISYISSDTELVTVDSRGVVRVVGDVPEEGKAVYVTAIAGSSNNSVYAECKVVVGNYDGNRKVAALTIAAYPGTIDYLTPHGYMALTAYEDIRLDVSYLAYYRLTKKYADLMKDYKDHPEKYSSDPVLYNNDDLKIPDRESYFNITAHEPYSRPAKVLLKKGDSIDIGNSTYNGEDRGLIGDIIFLLEDGTISSSRHAAELLRQLKYLSEDPESFDAGRALDGFMGTFIEAYRTALKTGHNPIDRIDPAGGICINKLKYTQFTSEVSRLPNNYYTADITADELARVEKYVSDPSHNYFSFVDVNCAYQASHIWNAAFEDKPELQVRANYTGFTVEPVSLYVELGLMAKNHKLEGHGGSNFIPRTPVDVGSSEGGSVTGGTDAPAVTEPGAPSGTDAPAATEPETHEDEVRPAVPSEIVSESVPVLRGVKVKAAKKAFTVKWKKLSNKQRKAVGRITVQYSKDPSFRHDPKTVYVSSGKASCKVKKLRKGDVYYVRTRTVLKSDPKCVSAWSAAKRVKVK